ncbi:MAG: hypothetical protein AAB662_01310 [Patescibacteria group bacterium]
MNSLKEVKNLRKRNRSSRYPSLSLEYAVKVIEEARKFGKNVTSANLGGTGAKSGAYIRKKASLGYYGLLSGTGDNLQITDLADKIVYAKSEEEKANSLRQAFLSPDLFSTICQKIEKNTPINLEVLGNVFIRDYGIQPSAKKALLQNFVSSGIFANVIKYSGENKRDIIFSDNDKGKEEKTSVIMSQQDNEASRGISGNYTIDLPSGIIISFPADMKFNVSVGEFAQPIRDLEKIASSLKEKKQKHGEHIQADEGK